MRTVSAFARRALRHLHFRLVSAPRGRGRVIPKTTWDGDYRLGVWDHLDSLDEMAHYAVIAGYVAAPELADAPAVLDVGCGRGILYHHLRRVRLDRYVGVDLSSEALVDARRRAGGGASFEQADFESWEVPRRFDFVVFNESLYYARDPAATLTRYGTCLTAGGYLIVSIYRNGHEKPLWRSIERHASAVHGTTVDNGRGGVWDIRVLRPGRVAPFHTASRLVGAAGGQGG